MERGRRDQPLERAKAPAHVRVDEEPPESHEQHQQGGDHRSLDALRRAESENVDRDQPAEPDEGVVNWVGARADQKVDVLRVMVDRVETPEQGELVRPAMAPVEAKVGHHKGGEPTNPDRPGCDLGPPTAGNDLEGKIGGDRERDQQHERRKERADEIEPEVARRRRAKRPLLVQRKQHLEWNEDDRQDQQPDARPDEVAQIAVNVRIGQQRRHCGFLEEVQRQK